MTLDTQTVALLLTAVSAAFAAFAALANWQQARKAAQANEVAVYLALTEKYGTEETREAIFLLAQFWRSAKDRSTTVSDAFVDELANSPENARKLRGYSRSLTAFFVSAARLYEGRFISEKLVKSLIARPGLNVFYEVAVPINLARNPHASSARYAALLKRITPLYGTDIY